jgi:RHS repeat-associated protein
VCEGVVQANNGARAAFAYNLRFPGQYFDAETGKHYNYKRDYDPRIGRYIESDPIGLQAGPNTYGYVGGNPLKWIDPKGLLQKPGTGLGGNQRDCPYVYHLELVTKPNWFVEEVTAQCFYYCGPRDNCPANPKDYVRSFIVYDVVRIRFWPGNPCPPTWSFDM